TTRSRSDVGRAATAIENHRCLVEGDALDPPPEGRPQEADSVSLDRCCRCCSAVGAGGPTNPSPALATAPTGTPDEVWEGLTMADVRRAHGDRAHRARVLHAVQRWRCRSG